MIWGYDQSILGMVVGSDGAGLLSSFAAGVGGGSYAALLLAISMTGSECCGPVSIGSASSGSEPACSSIGSDTGAAAGSTIFTISGLSAWVSSRSSRHEALCCTAMAWAV